MIDDMNLDELLPIHLTETAATFFPAHLDTLHRLAGIRFT